MNKIKYLSLLLLAFFFCAFVHGQKLSKQTRNFSTLSPRNNIITVYKTNILGVDFVIGLDKDKNKTMYIYSNDLKFMWKDSAIIGQPLGLFKNKKDLKLVPGWGHYLKLGNNWYAAFNLGKVSDTSKVLFVFQYQFH